MKLNKEISEHYQDDKDIYILDKVEFLGHGYHGNVFMTCEILDEKKEVAIKLMNSSIYGTSESEKHLTFLSEVLILKKCKKHLLILKYLDSFRNKKGDIYIVTEYAN